MRLHHSDDHCQYELCAVIPRSHETQESLCQIAIYFGKKVNGFSRWSFWQAYPKNEERHLKFEDVKIKTIQNRV